MPLSKNLRHFFKDPFVVALVFQTGVLAVILLFCDIKYEVSDDYVMEMILSGVYTGKNDIHIMFSNVLWACLLLPAYKLFPAVSWYFVGQITVCFFSLVAISYVLCKSSEKHMAAILSALLTAFTAMDLYILPQFTKTAIAAVFSGSLLFLWALLRAGSRKHILLGGALVLVGSWIRISAVYVAAPFILIILICELLCVLRKEKVSLTKLIKDVAVPGICLVAIVFFCSGLDDFVYAQDNSYLYFRQYSKARANIVDYAWPQYSEYEDEFQEIGVSENDYLMITGWNLGDSQVYSLETLQKVGDIVRQDRQATDVSERQFITVFKNRQLRYPGALLCVALGIMCICIDWKKAWAPVLSAFVCVLFFFYYYYIGRMVYRVEFGYYFCAAVLIAFYCKNESKGIRKRKGLLLAAVAAILVAVQIPMYLSDQEYDQLDDAEYREYVDGTFYYSWNFDSDKYSKVICEGDIRPGFLDEVRSHPECLYIMEFYTSIQTLYYDFPPYVSASACFPKNVVFLGGVTVNHPSVVDCFTSQNTGSLLRKLVEDNVFLITNRAETLMHRYLLEHGYPNATVKSCGALDGYAIWQYSANE